MWNIFNVQLVLSYKRAYLLSVRHRNLTSQGTDIDEQVKVHVYLCRRQCGVNDHSFTSSGGRDKDLGALVLFCNQGWNVGFETASANTCAIGST
jgi:hypothetical protein